MILLDSSFITPCRTRRSDWCAPLPPHGNAVGLLHHAGLGSSRFARRYSGSRCYFPFLRVLRCFSSPGYLHRPYVFRPGYERITTRAFAHSEIPGSKLARSSPRLIAACHVLLRLLAPRHPPWALLSLTHLKTLVLAMQFSRSAQRSGRNPSSERTAPGEARGVSVPSKLNSVPATQASRGGFAFL